MVKKETVKIMAMLCAFYGQGKGEPEAMADAWHIVLQEYSYNEACEAVINFAKTDTRDYATFPAVGKIVQEIEKGRAARGKAVNEVYLAIALNNRSYEDLSAMAKAICPPTLFDEWRAYSNRHADEFCANEAKYKGILRGNLNNLLEA